MKRNLFILIMLLALLPMQAQRYTDKLDRGLVAVPSSTSGNFVSWRIWGEEYYDVTYNLYCDGTLIGKELKNSSYNHTSGTSSSRYQVAAVVRGVEKPKSAEIKRWENAMLTIPVQKITRSGAHV